MALQTVATMTADELLVMPHNGYRYELIKGELRQMAPAGRQHGRIAATICSRLESFVRNNNLGEIYAAETGFLIWTDPDTVRAPDASFVSRARADATDEEEGFFPGAPDLAVEVISPNDRAVEVEDKALDWLRAGAKMVIVLNPKTRTATIYRGFDDIRILTEGDTIDGGDVVPGWQLPLVQMCSNFNKTGSDTAKDYRGMILAAIQKVFSRPLSFTLYIIIHDQNIYLYSGTRQTRQSLQRCDG